MKTDPPPRVAAVVETSLSVGRGILAGVGNYTAEHGPWSIHAYRPGLGRGLAQWIRNWQGDGIIARLQNPRIRDAVMGKGLPVVDVLGVCGSPLAALVQVDDAAIAGMAAGHLWEFGFREFAYLGVTPDNWSLARLEAFAAWAGHHGCPCPSLLLSRTGLARSPWDRLVARVAAWLRGLPLPIGLMLSSDAEGPLVADACREAGLVVGGNVGFIGAGNDRTLCELTTPPLSSVEVDIQTLGYRAAEVLDAMMAGRPAPKAPVRIAPLFVETRASTGFPAVVDPALARALRFMRARLAEPLGIDAIAAHAGISRTVLQRRFRQHTGRTVMEELTRLRLQKALELLQTNLTVEQIAQRAGFIYPQNLARSFHKHFNKSPKHFRQSPMSAPENDPI